MSRAPTHKVKEATIDGMLDSYLRDWYGHSSTYTYGAGQGFHTNDATSRDYKTPYHQDWGNGAHDSHRDRQWLQSITSCVESIPNEPERWRTALELHARNLHYNITAWYSPVLPRCHEEREILIIEARTRFLIELRRRDLI